MIPTQDELDEKKWPRSVRSAVNWCIRILKRPKRVKFGNVVSPRWEDGENEEVITLPMRLSGDGSTSNDFSLYSAADGKIGVKNGTVSGTGFSGLPDGMTEGGTPAYEFVPSGSAGYVYLIVTATAETGSITSVTIGSAAEVPDDTDTIGYWPLGDYSVTSGVVSIGSGVQGQGSKAYEYCGGQHYFDPAQ